MWKVEYKKRFLKELSKLPEDVQSQVEKIVFEELTSGNPFILGPDGNRAEVIQKHAVWIGTQPELIAALPELIGKTLGCHCYPLPCHGDTLSRLADVAEQKLQDLAAWNAGTL